MYVPCLSVPPSDVLTETACVRPGANVPYSGAGAQPDRRARLGRPVAQAGSTPPLDVRLRQPRRGRERDNFNYTLTPGAMWNETGAGTLCLPSLPYPADFNATDGENGSLQVVTLGRFGGMPSTTAPTSPSAPMLPLLVASPAPPTPTSASLLSTNRPATPLPAPTSAAAAAAAAPRTRRRRKART